MNERIKDLMIKSGAFDHYEVNEGVNGDELPMVKFAELIIRECATIMDKDVDHPYNSRGSILKYHFGVEE